MAKIKEQIEEVLETVEPVKSELEILRELHAKLTELGINRIGQLETKIAELLKYGRFSESGYSRQCR